MSERIVEPLIAEVRRLREELRAAADIIEDKTEKARVLTLQGEDNFLAKMEARGRALKAEAERDQLRAMIEHAQLLLAPAKACASVRGGGEYCRRELALAMGGTLPEAEQRKRWCLRCRVQSALAQPESTQEGVGEIECRVCWTATVLPTPGYIHDPWCQEPGALKADQTSPSASSPTPTIARSSGRKRR